MNKKQLAVLWLLAAWMVFAFFYAARHVEEPGVMEQAKAKLSGEPLPAPTVTYEFVWDRDAGTFALFALPALLVAVPLILTLRRQK